MTGTDADGDGVTVEDGDCDDTDPAIRPGLPEECDGIDQNCNGVVDEGYDDTDHDTIADCIDEEECDGLDNDGDGRIDEDFADDNGNGIADCAEDEICDGIDNDGDGHIDEDFDADGDGYTTCGDDSTPADCDDEDASIHPGAGDAEGDLIDNDCDGMVDETEWDEGDVFVTEIMNNPYEVTDPDGEWFEIYNASGRELILNGMVITSTSGDDWYQVTSRDILWLGPEEHFVFGINGDMATNGGVDVGAVYSDVTLLNEEDDLLLMMGDVIVDEVSWDDGATMPDPQGATMTLDPEAYGDILNDSSASWCQASFEWAENSDYGSPNELNEYCFPVAQANYDTSASLTSCSEFDLIGSESYDPDGAGLTYEWELVSAPSDSDKTTADIEESDEADPSFTPDRAGTYVFALTVYNGTEYSSPAYVTVEVTERDTNFAPVADAGDDETYTESSTCTPISYGVYYECDACGDATFDLDATGTYDDDGDYIASYAWEITGGTGSGSIEHEDRAETEATMSGPDAEYGVTTTETLIITLTVEDCMGATDTDEITLTYECTGA
ncbi:MAG: lamin tail domain-containing protein [Alphaproteobacteria bacterium]|nr:lamin tail domain-containing protein [Alphaproteobacteria bacterium]